MSAYIEIEKKYKLLSNDIDNLLSKFNYIGKKQVIDEYFDTSDGYYYKEGIFIRIRNNKKLDIKFNPDHLGKSNVTEHTSCHEYSFTEPFSESNYDSFNQLCKLINVNHPKSNTFNSFINRNKLVPLITIDKIRTSYKNSLYTLVIDDIKDLGLFLEVEYSGNQKNLNLNEILSKIDNLMKNTPSKQLSSGSFEMILKKKNLDLYKQGKYLLEEDS